jgi:CRISPR/Cas system endoribonuclease Cas6 (RAMP superfamily)
VIRLAVSAIKDMHTDNPKEIFLYSVPSKEFIKTLYDGLSPNNFLTYSDEKVMVCLEGLTNEYKWEIIESK